MALKVRKNGAWVDIADNSANTTYTLPTFGTINGSSGLRLTGSDSTTDDVNITGANGITVVGNASNNTLTIDGGGAGSNTTYDLEGGGTDGGSFGTGIGKVILVPSTGTNDEVSITAGSNVKIDNTGTGGFTISAASGSGGSSTFLGLTDVDPTTYTGQANKLVKVNSTPDGLEFVDERTYSLPLTGATGASGTGEATWTLTPSGPGGTSDSVKIKAGANISIDATSVASGEFTISASSGTATISDGDYGDITVSSTGSLWRIDNDVIEEKHINAGGTAAADKVLVYDASATGKWKWSDQTGTTYSQEAGASGANVQLRLKNNKTNTFDDILITKGAGIAFGSVTADGFTISADTQDGTTYTLPTFGTTNAASGIKLTPDGGAASATQTINITGTNGITVVGNASNNTLTIDGQNAGSDTTYSQEAGADGANVKLRLKDDTTSTFDDILLTKGSGITFSSVTAEGFTISADTQDGTLYTLPIFGNANGSSGIELTPDGGTASASQTVNINGTNGITVIGSGTDTLTIDGQNAGSNTTYTLPLTGTSSNPAGSTGNGEAIWTLTDNASPVNEDPVKIKAGTNISISVDSGNSEFTISASSGTATIEDGTYGDIEVGSSGSDWQIRADTVGISELSATGTSITTKFLRGDNTWAAPTSVTYDLTAEDGDNGTSEKIRLTGGGDEDNVVIAVTGSLAISRSSNTITIDGSGVAGSNYTIPVYGTANGLSGIRLLKGSTDHDMVSIFGMNGISVRGNATGGGFNGSALVIDGQNAGTNTTYELQGGGTDSSTFPGGTGTIKLNTGGATQDTVTVTAGDNIRIDNTGTSGFEIHAAEVGSGAFKFKNTGTGTGTGTSNKAVFQLYTTSNTSGDADQRITITPGSGIKFSGQGTQTLTIEGEAQSAGTINVSAPTTQSGPLLFVTATGDDKTVYGDTALTWNASTDTLNIGANASDKVAINADVSTHIYPSQNEAFDIGESSTNRWRKLYVKEIAADIIGGTFAINTNDEEVLFTDVSGSNKVVAGSSKFKFDGNQLEISNTGNTNFIHLTHDAGLEICRSTYAGTGSPGGAFIDFKDNPSIDDYDCRIQQITSAAGGDANANLPGGLQFYSGLNKPKAVITTEGVFGISGSWDVSNNISGFCPGHPPLTSQPRNWDGTPYILDVNGKAFFRAEKTTGWEGGHIHLQGMYDGADRGWSIDSYSGPVSVGDRRRIRILSEFSIASSGRADQLFCMNRNGAVAWGNSNSGQTWPAADANGAEDYGATGAVLVSMGYGAPPRWSTSSNSSGGGASIEFSSPLKLARDNATGEGGGILLAKSNSSTFSAAWEIDANGTSSTPDFRVVDSSAAQVRFGINSVGALSIGQWGNYGLTGQVIMSRGSSNRVEYSHRPTTSNWWDTSKESVPVIDQSGVMEIGKYIDFHTSRTSGSDYNARIENTGDLVLTVRNYIQNYSDSRIKDNLVVIGSSLDKVGIITGYTYNYNNTGEESPSRTGGVIAQDVEKILPELVKETSDGIKALNYNGITALLVEAVKELKAKNTALEARIAALESS
tara:strand:- start:787 stop:5418 length:4632 start_codon:yes stop_codon:yes gene_type:complete